ncbi:hypothetical protein OD350_24860 [Clostridium beijerinckii]|uniref:Uncharacterized protein n=1 Tax=Clostridium beijerinckii TaxID=1520 RepID=A0AAX0AZS4_CLOBE|nr:hypothetical protein [Clostridium beijerinckii]NRT32637.1 hypothetical protein [Clostridium beijerinckii]NRT47935.1 hypothetical protein [Clostridium beijerinckii]NRT88540.1 hypothetical protein [Clostridium beijerinckii]NRT90192.1 hypothetical protein [Clostridium beijerinckii]NRZ23769.1 hypothetical protein [Clostridium beijerinckii]
MRLSKEEILGRASKEYLGKNYYGEINTIIDIYTFSGIVYSVIDVIEKMDNEKLEIKDSTNNVQGN